MTSCALSRRRAAIQETVDSVMETGIEWMLIENEEPPVNCFEEVRLDRERILGSYGFREE